MGDNALPKAGRVPHVVYGNADPSYLWPTLFFPSWATVVGVNETDYGYCYRAPHHQHWVDGSFTATASCPGTATSPAEASRAELGLSPARERPVPRPGPQWRQVTFVPGSLAGWPAGS
jgi:hypothetical protein